VRRPVFQRIFWDLGPGHKPNISLEKYKTVIKLLVAATVGGWGLGASARCQDQTPDTRHQLALRAAAT
jgi:hypothetical protein